MNFVHRQEFYQTHMVRYRIKYQQMLLHLLTLLLQRPSRRVKLHKIKKGLIYTWQIYLFLRCLTNPSIRQHLICQCWKIVNLSNFPFVKISCRMVLHIVSYIYIYIYRANPHICIACYGYVCTLADKNVCFHSSVAIIDQSCLWSWYAVATLEFIMVQPATVATIAVCMI